jgi:organic hydroperoxide reductase OsmC/OhrA
MGFLRLRVDSVRVLKGSRPAPILNTEQGGTNGAISLHGQCDCARRTSRSYPLVGWGAGLAPCLSEGAGRPGGAATNPEQLFAAGYAACFENALIRVARERRAPLRESSVTAHVGIGRGADGYFRLQVIRFPAD